MADYRARYPRYFCCGNGVKQMVSAAFGFNQRTGLLPLEGDPESARGGVTSWAIYSVYENFFHLSWKKIISLCIMGLRYTEYILYGTY